MAAFSKCSIFIFFFLLLFLVYSINGNICYLPSANYTQDTWDEYSCDEVCREIEGALEGKGIDSCLCKYNCDAFCDSFSGAYRGPCWSNDGCATTCREQDKKFSGACTAEFGLLSKCACTDYCQRQ